MILRGTPNRNLPQLEHHQQLSSPMPRNRTDSLVFSVTSQKFYSPRDTILIDSKQQDVSQELETLQLKLEHLEHKIERVDSRECPIEAIRYDAMRGREGEQKQNSFAQANKAGKIVRKERELSKTTKIERRETRKTRVETFATHQSRNSRRTWADEQELTHKIRELSQLRKEVSAMRQSMEKTQRSKSLCSERLSASKDLVKSLKHRDKSQARVLERLRAELRKSESIREKQKQLIAKQQAELSYFRQLFSERRPIR